MQSLPSQRRRTPCPFLIGAPDSGAILILREGGARQAGLIIKVVVRVQHLVTDVLVDAAMKGVPPRFSTEIDYTAGEASVFRRNGIAEYPEFLNRILSRHQRYGIDVTRIDRSPINKGSALVGKAAADLVFTPPIGIGKCSVALVAQCITLRCALSYHARRQRDEVHHIAAVQRSVLNHTAMDHLTQG